MSAPDVKVSITHEGKYSWLAMVMVDGSPIAYASRGSKLKAVAFVVRAVRPRKFGDNLATLKTEILSEVLLQKISAPGLLESWRNPEKYDIFGAWTSLEWYGSIKPSTDMLKQAKGSKMLVQEGWSTNAREARITTGTKFSKNIKRLKRENQLKVEALTPIAEFESKFAPDIAKKAVDALENATIELMEATDDNR